ncbi:hypothetical protein LRY65_03445 [Candidatus Woesebacteria bacterium]|nr:hypothetical protein [Candidatus Woesebacteria bacterium]MCD8506949.1 hypothetical protein [Candidatus Woesebacteria bacterium]MCD8527239.1 hypothetical protein [Candidatus Woesebacteria bacterium]MCD8546606.1 hypothetical protein [Candidatus Woesebacteria bacterium]
METQQVLPFKERMLAAFDTATTLPDGTRQINLEKELRPLFKTSLETRGFRPVGINTTGITIPTTVNREVYQYTVDQVEKNK